MISNVLTATALLGLANGHMIMNTPYPYNFHKSSPLLQVNPLGEGFPFPCQGVSTIEETTSITAGQPQLVKFTGGAQHGGGSCQFSLTYEYPPPADKSKWKTIYTLIGGCPVSAAGNLPAASPDQDGRANSPQCGSDSGVECIRQFNIPIPKDIPNGNATFAWTWLNKMGNREIYMSCAPVSITGGSDDAAFFDALPQMFVANIPGECTTGNGVMNIPNPGQFGKVLEQPTPGSEGSCPKADGIPTFDGAANPPSGPSPNPGDKPQAPPAPAQPTTFATITTTATPPAPAPAAPTTDSPSPGSGSVGGGTCSPGGAIVCIGGTHFGICDHGHTVPQPLAPGTTCSGGVISRRRAPLPLF
ncbi:hypothetical protein B0T25DRAFT_624260 [Lasiosphaeria hispida]|uniref:Lytic polysaccharide monooxygenase n=1 Tax=Lasiosphaeria hispida TaxID=260671 RepID=A0AAJ0HFW2_9PEZI|nr:hypothetical protein B0T25DRAFT_624260 [Lasiosphaeria hispida]